MNSVKVTKSGNHPAVIAHRRKMDSINETTLPALEALNERLDRAIEKAQADDGENGPQSDEPESDEPESGETPPRTFTKP